MTSFPKFQTKVHANEAKVIQGLASTLQGPRPPMLKDVVLGEESDTAVKAAKQNSEQSFLRKYVRYFVFYLFLLSITLSSDYFILYVCLSQWYVVLPMVIFVLFGGGGGDEKKDGAPAGGAAPPAAPGAK